MSPGDRVRYHDHDGQTADGRLLELKKEDYPTSKGWMRVHWGLVQFRPPTVPRRQYCNLGQLEVLK